MAREVLHVISDDLDGSPEARTVEFGLDTVSYTIDLAWENEEALRAALEPYLQVARKVGTQGRGTRSQPKASNRDRNMAIREWAFESGVQLPSRGRIASGVIEAYDAGDVDGLFAAVGLEREPEKPSRRRGPAAPRFSSAG
jgi:hypothetical protein